jgi:hypothetical protein
MMAKTRKRVTMLVTVSMPSEITAAQARREVKSRVKDLCNEAYETDESVVKFISLTPALKRTPRARRATP